MVHLRSMPSQFPACSPSTAVQRAGCSISELSSPHCKHPCVTFTAVLQKSVNLGPGWPAWSILLGTPRGMHAERTSVLALLHSLAHKFFLCSRHMLIITVWSQHTSTPHMCEEVP